MERLVGLKPTTRGLTGKVNIAVCIFLVREVRFELTFGTL